jgi:hypothetical protein
MSGQKEDDLITRDPNRPSVVKGGHPEPKMENSHPL